MEIKSVDGFPTHLPYDDPTEGLMTPYTPPKVTNPHPSHVISRFYPINPTTGQPVVPVLGDRFPVIVYSANIGWLESVPVFERQFLFLSKALEMGWMVITVGSTGWNSEPTCFQPDTCLSDAAYPAGCTPPMVPCRDPGLWFEPTEDVNHPWYDFNYFYAEKDMAWALQYISFNAAALHVDPERIVVAGLSGGSVSASFVGFLQPNWSETIDPSLIPGSQEVHKYSPAAVVLFEPIAWSEGIPPEQALNGASSGHWPDEANPRQRYPRPGVLPLETGGIEHVMPLSTLETQSASRWIRQTARQIPTFIASGEGLSLRSGFGRDGSGAGSVLYDRSSASPVPEDPEYSIPASTLPGQVLAIHDTWHALNLKRDLMIADPAYHEVHSELWLRKFQLNWDFYPNFLPFQAIGAAPFIDDVSFVPALSDMPIVDGLLDVHDSYIPLDNLTPVDPSSNLAVAREIMEWLDRELRPGVEGRNAGSNPNVFTGSPIRMGEDWVLTLDLNLLPSDYNAAAWLASYAPTELSADSVAIIGPDQWFLVDIFTAGMDVTAEFGLLGTEFEDLDGLVVTTLPVPRDPSLFGVEVSVQACLYDFSGGPPPAEPVLLSNAQDFVFLDGFYPDVPFINEIHYLESGAGDKEYIEIAGVAGTQLNAYDLHVYNMAGDNFMTVVDIGVGLIPAQAGTEFGTVVLEVPGLPNDGGGLVLVDSVGNVVGFEAAGFQEFLSWGGTPIVPLNGPALAAGITASTDVGVETGSATDSLQREATPGTLVFPVGVFSSNFAEWVGPVAETPGAFNVNQEFPAPPVTTGP